VYNDKCWQVKELLEYIKNTNLECLLEEIDSIIEFFKLSKTNKEGYLELRKYYNTEKHTPETFNPIVFYMLVCHAFNYQIVFNAKLEYNLPFGKDRSYFSDTLRQKLVTFKKALDTKEVIFKSTDFSNIIQDVLSDSYDRGIFVYADPPYFSAKVVSSYSRTALLRYGLVEEERLYDCMEQLNKSSIKFGLSNVMESRGVENTVLKEWSKNYNVHYIISLIIPANVKLI